MTDSEKRLWWHLDRIAGGMPHFRRQAPIGPYVFDFVSHGAKLVIEVDGAQHGYDAQAGFDAARTRWLDERGYRVLRFWNHEVQTEIEVVLDTVRAALYSSPSSSGDNADTPTPSPSPQGGGE